MKTQLQLVKPHIVPPLDEDYCPAVLANRTYQQKVEESGVGAPLILGLARTDGSFSCFETQVFPEGHDYADYNLS